MKNWFAVAMLIFVILPTIVGCEQPQTKAQVQQPPKDYRLEFIETQPINDWGFLCIIYDKQTENDLLLISTTSHDGGAPGVAVWPLGPHKKPKSNSSSQEEKRHD